jgi:hypothetical protein
MLSGDDRSVQVNAVVRILAIFPLATTAPETPPLP